MKLRRFFGWRRLPAFLDRFASKHLAEVLRSIGRPPATAIETFPRGRIAVVRCLILADGSSLVLRVYFADPAKQEAFTHCYLNRRLAERGFRVPAIHLRRVFPFARGEFDAEVVIEDFVEGVEINDAMQDDEALRRRLVETLRRLHSDRSPQPGRTWTGRTTGDPVLKAGAKAPVRFARVRRLLPEVTSRQVDQYLAWFRDAVARRTVPDAYELTHGDFNRGNVLVTSAGEIALIDLGTTVYGCFEADLADARWMFPERAWWEAFCRDYFADQPQRQDRFERNAPLFFANLYLTKAARQAAGARKALEKGRPQTAEARCAKGRFYWNELVATIEG